MLPMSVSRVLILYSTIYPLSFLEISRLLNFAPISRCSVRKSDKVFILPFVLLDMCILRKGNRKFLLQMRILFDGGIEFT